MYIARILYPVEVLGPGRRIGIWLCGCSRGCKGCSNPELWQVQDKYKISIDSVLELIHQISDKNQVDGFTITGGDPMEQSEELQHLLKMLKRISDDVLVYTGFKIEELTENQLENISVLIDGAYIEELNDNSLLCGSSNQRIHILEEKQRVKYETYLNAQSNKIQNFTTNDGTVSVGIHRPGFMKEKI